MRIAIITFEGMGSSVIISEFLKKLSKDYEVVAIISSFVIFKNKGFLKSLLHLWKLSGPKFIFLQGLLVLSYKAFQIIGRFSKKYEIKSLEKIAEERGIPFVHSEDINSKKEIEKLQELDMDLLVSVYFNQRVGGDVLAVPKKGAINIHGALLPHYKGLMPNIWVLANGEKETGVTVHSINEKFDDGQILVQKKIHILQNETPAGLYLRISSLGADLLIAAIKNLERKTPDFHYHDEQKNSGSYYSWPNRKAFEDLKKNKIGLFSFRELFKILKTDSKNMPSNFLKLAEPVFNGNEMVYLKECLDSKRVSGGGKFVKEFEEGVAKFCRTNYGTSSANGTVALHLALLSLGIGRGDEVLVPDFSFVSSISAILHAGAEPVIVDIDENTWCIDSQKIKDKITPKTKAIIVVHIFGHPADMDPILEIAKQYNIKIIEDAAEALGAEYKGRRVGGIGDVGTFSFYGNKVITAGEGGVCVTNDEAIYEKIRLLKNHHEIPGKNYQYSGIGYNYRMSNISAAVGLAQFEKIDEFLNHKLSIAGLYNEGLRGVKDIVLPPKAGWAKNIYWLYSILLKNEEQRDALIKYLGAQGIESRPFFAAFHLMSLYRPYVRRGDSMEIAESVSKRGINLPSGAGLTDEEVGKIIYFVKEFLNANV